MSPVNCPSVDELSAYVIGELPDHRADEVAFHVDTCADCHAAIETLDQPDDKLVRSLRQSLALPAFVVEDACRRAVARLQECVPVPWNVESGDVAMPAAPSGRLTHLGGYEFVWKLGEGGMGTVYKARQPRLDRWVAVKVLPANRLGDARAVARFQREIKSVGKLQHPNIVVAHDAGEEDGMHYLVMEHVEGLNLSDLVRRCGPLPVADACAIVRQAALALQHAHEHGLVHRDVKPSNLMLTTAGPTTGQVKLLDLGLALFGAEKTAPDELTGANQWMGTADYMAPEQAGDSRAVDIRADVYSLGCTLYKLLAGAPPFADAQYATSLQKMLAHAHEAVPPISKRRNDVPAALVAVLAGMLAKRPADRYSTPASAAAALAPFAAGSDLPRLAVRCASASSIGNAVPGDPGVSPPTDAAAPVPSSNTAPCLFDSLTGTHSSALVGSPVPGTVAKRLAGSRRRRALYVVLAALLATATVVPLIAFLHFGNGGKGVEGGDSGTSGSGRDDGNARVAIPDKFRDAVELTADGKPLKVSGHAVTRLVDWDGDGVFDLLVGDGDGNVWLFRNIGSKTDFRLASGEHIVDGQTNIRAGIGNTTACFVDMTGDGKRDLIVAHSDDRVLVWVNQGAADEPEFEDAAPLSGRDGTEFRLPNGCGARIDVGDWDGDGRADILAGGYLGSIVLYRNTGTAALPRFEAAGVPLTSQGKAWSEPYNVHPTLCDLNQDGRPDVAYGTNWGYFSFFISDAQPRNCSAFAFPSYPLRLGNLDLRAIAGDDSTPTFGDVNGDGTLDLVSGGAIGKLWLLLGVRQSPDRRDRLGPNKHAR